MEFILLIAGIVAFIWFATTGSRREHNNNIALSQGRESARRVEFQECSDRLEKSLRQDWPFIHDANDGWMQKNYIAMSADQDKICVVRTKQGEKFLIDQSVEIHIDKIVSVEIQQDSNTIMKITTSAETRKSGSLGRAAVGGVLLGGAGAIVGVVSGGSRTTANTVSESQTVKGPVYLVIGTTEISIPVLKVVMRDRDAGEQWLYRIRGALSLNGN